MRVREVIKERKNTFLLAVAIFAILLTWTLIHSFSENVDDSGWDGVVASSFAGGTGSTANPYIISNASEFAHFKAVLEGDDASFYANKNYVITSSFNYGGNDIAINNSVPFSGTLDGGYGLIYNAIATNSIMIATDGATIKNINFDDVTITATKDSGLLINTMKDTNIIAISLNVTVIKDESVEKALAAGIAFSDVGSTIKDVVVNVITEGVDYVSLVNSTDDTEFNNVLVATDSIKSNSDVDLSQVYEINFNNDNLSLDGKLASLFSNDDYFVVVKNNKILFEKSTNANVEEQPTRKGTFGGPLRSAGITLHASGVDTANGNIYINDLTSDYNYYMGLNYTKITNSNGTIPGGSNQQLYSNNNLATVYIRYSGADYNNSTVYGTVSVSETISNFYYYKRYPVVDGYLTFDLIDNPWANRPNDMAFNGWVTDYTGAVVSINVDTYVRSVKIPVSDITEPISITFYSSWTTASVATSTAEISTNLKNAGMTEVPGDYGDLTNYYISDHISYGDYYPTDLGNLYNMSGTRITRTTCNSFFGGCDFVKPNTSNVYDSSEDYYTVTPNGNNATLTQVYPTKVASISYYDIGDEAAGLFIRVTSGTENIYSSTGEKLTSCGNSCYKLLQYGEATINNTETYYYLVTRDTNIFAPSTTSAITASNILDGVPMTITGINNGVDNSTSRLINMSSSWTMDADIRIEFIRLYGDAYSTTVSALSSGYKIIGNFYNLKIGRGIKQYTYNGRTYLTAATFAGGNSTSTNSVTNYTLIVESGFYQNGSGVGFTTSYDHLVHANVTLGNDYDRIDENNDNLIVYYCYAGTWASYLYSSSDMTNTYDDPAIYTVVKSGTFGNNKQDYAAGVYTGGRASGSYYAIREVLVEGGYIYNLLGGPGSASSRASKNDIVINVKGGEIDLIFGGAGASDTVGNRILNVTGGTINYAVFGGSNAAEYSSNTSNPYGKIDGDTLLYVGGNVTVGTKNDTLFTVSSGDVYGAGNGRSGELDVGAVNNSNVIIGPSATINGDVYGGGNNGAVGGNTVGTYELAGSATSESTDSGVYEDGTTDNNIRYYGATPDNYIRFGNENYRIIGLFNNVSTSSGSKNLVRIIKPTSSSTQAWANEYITNSGSNNRYYSNYFVRNNTNETKSSIYTYLNTTFYNNLNATYRNYIQSVNWGLAGTETAGHTAADFYTIERGNTAGSDYSRTTYNYNIGLFYPSDYGFATNDSDCASAYLTTYGNNNSTCDDTWFGNIITNDAWTMTPSTYYDTSTSGNGYNRRTNYRYYAFYLGSNDNLGRSRVYGTSYQTYAVYPSFYLKDDIRIASGSGASDDPYVIGSSGDLLTDIIYDLMHPTVVEPEEPEEPEIVTHTENQYQNRTHIQITGGTVKGSVFGAGNNNGAGNNIKGSSGRVALSKINIDMTGGSVEKSIYGGANAKETVYGDVFINIENGDIGESVYGGGKGGYVSASDKGTYVACNVNVEIGSANTTSLTIHDSVYGGSAYGSVNTTNQTATVSSYATSVEVNDGVIVGSVFGGGEGDTTHTPKVVGPITVTINDGDITSVFGGNDQAGEHTALNKIYLRGGTIDDVYGGGNSSSVDDTHVYLEGAEVNNIYGGSNTLGDVNTTTVEIKSGEVHNVYGGNNAGGTCAVTNVKVQGTATITGSVYGGGSAVDTTTSNVNLVSAGATIPAVYGGGYSASVGTATINKGGTTVTELFGGSNSNGTVTTSTINHNGGTTTTLYGGNNAGGNTLASHVNMHNGTVITLYGGGKNAAGDTSEITMDGGTVTTMFGGGNSAGLDSSQIGIIGGAVTTIYGGSNTTGTVDETSITYNHSSGTVTDIYGGGNNAPVGDTSVTFTAGTAGTIYGGGKSAQTTGSTTVDINGGTITTVFGGGDAGSVAGSSNTTITNANILGNAYAGGNGSAAVVNGNSYITIDGDTTVGTANSVAPNAGCVFGGGSAAATGTQTNNGSTTTVNIVGGTIYGNVYGGAKFAVVYGNTVVNIGQSAYTSQNLQKDDIDIRGHIFGGGEANSSGSSDIYDWSFISVTRGVSITVDADTYDNFNIDGSFFGGGNASTASGDSYLMIRNYGTTGNPEYNVSIQRVTYATIENSSILLDGAVDRANDYDKEKFSISRVDRLKIKDNSEIYFVSGTNLLGQFMSVDANDVKAKVTLNTETNTITEQNVDNRIYIYEGKNVNIAHDQQTDDVGEVTGMTFLGLFNFDNNLVNNGIYNASYDPGDTLPAEGLFAKGAYVLGKHYNNHNIEVDGFYSNFRNSTTKKNEINYIDPTPDDSPFYMWYIGENAVSYNINLVASKYSTMGALEYTFRDFAAPNTSFQILTFESTKIAQGVSLVNRNNIPRIAANVNDANNVFGLSMEASNSGWLTTGKTNFYTSNPSINGVKYYEGENSSVAPTMLFYLYHSKNITEEKDLGTVSITIQATTKINSISNEIRLLVVNVNMSTALFNTVEYEGAMTPGDKYELFMSTTTNIASKSKYSAYFALYGADANLYKTGYHRVLTSTFVFPENTKITMLDFINGVPEYYYHVITASDVTAAEADFQANNNQQCAYALSMFTRMGSVSNNSNYNDASKNAIYYDGTNSNEEFIFIVDFSDANITSNKLNQKLLIEIRDSNEEDIVSVLGLQHSQLTYNVYYGLDSSIDITSTPSDNPLYVGYSDTFDVLINYQNSTLSGVSITDTQYFDSKMGVQIYLKNNNGEVVSGTDLTGCYFLVDETRYYPDISGYTHIKLADKVGNTRKWIIFNAENSSLITGNYTFVFEAFASPDGIYYSSGEADYATVPVTIINSSYGLNPVINDETVIFSANNDKSLKFTIDYTSRLDNPNIRLAMYRREYDSVDDTDYELVDFQDYCQYELTTTNNVNEYLLIVDPSSTNGFTYQLNSQLLTGTYRLSFRLYDDDTMIGEVNRYIIIK